MPQPVADRGGLLEHLGAVLAGVRLLVGLVAEVLQFHVEVVGAEDVAEVEEGGAGLGVAAGVDEIADLAVAAAGEADEPLGMGAQRLEGDVGGRSRSGSARWAAEMRRQRLA